MLLDQITELVLPAVEDIFGKRPSTLAVDFPADRAFGDVTINAFLLARALRQPPPLIAEKLAAALSGLGPIRSAEAVKGYVNLRLDTESLFRGVIPEILADPDAFARSASRRDKRILVEFSAPNTNKPQHLGHMRNNFLGDSVSRLLANASAEVVKVNLYNDRGIQICKSMLAYLKWGEGIDPIAAGIKGDHFVGRMYVRFERELAAERDRFVAEHPEDFEEYRRTHGRDRKGRPLDEDTLRKRYLASFREENFGKLALGRECQEMLRAWEAGEPEVLELWERMNAWAFSGFDQTYERLGISFDRVYRESQTWKYGRDLVLKGLEKGVFSRRSDGAVEIDLTPWNLGRKVVLRPDGTSVYITQDIGSTVRKYEDIHPDVQIWVVAEEQRHHFLVLFKILELMGYEWAKDLHHLSYGLVHLPEGRMKSREGKVVDADDLMDEVRDLAAEEIRKRDTERSIEDEEILRRAEVIALASLRFMLLKVSPQNSMTFNPEESVRFEGDTGARILYAYARLETMIRDAGEEAAGREASFGLLRTEAERNLALSLLEYPPIAARAAANLSPADVANYLIEVVRDLNRFYEQCPVLREEDAELRRARLLLCRGAAATLRHGCGLLGMPLLERM